MQHDLPGEVETLLATLMADPPAEQIGADTDRLEAAIESSSGAAPEALDELRSAVALVRGGQKCAAVSALLAARSVLSMRSV